MTQIVADAEMAKQIGAADGPVNVVDATGALIAICTPLRAARGRCSREELERRREEARKHPELNKTTAEVLEHLRRLGEERA